MKKSKSKRRARRAEVMYRDKLFLIIDATKKALRKEIGLFQELNPDADELAVYKFVDNLLEKKKRVSLGEIAENYALNMLNLVNNSVKKELNKDFGIDVTKILNTGNIKEEFEKALVQNVSLIKSLNEDYVSNIQDKIRNAFIGGERHETLTQIIIEETGFAKNRARIIARDQTSKLSADFKRVRAAMLGFDYYIWSGCDDGRERPSHKAMNDKFCKFTDPTVYSEDEGKTWKKRTKEMVKLNPGQDICCRCSANIVG